LNKNDKLVGFPVLARFSSLPLRFFRFYYFQNFSKIDFFLDCNRPVFSKPENRSGRVSLVFVKPA
jgi:hypothetical protein